MYCKYSTYSDRLNIHPQWVYWDSMMTGPQCMTLSSVRNAAPQGTWEAAHRGWKAISLLLWRTAFLELEKHRPPPSPFFQQSTALGLSAQAKQSSTWGLPPDLRLWLMPSLVPLHRDSCAYRSLVTDDVLCSDALVDITDDVPWWDALVDIIDDVLC